MARRRRIWSELVPLDLLAKDDALLRALARRELSLLVAVQPQQRDEALAVVRRARAHGLSIGLWPLLDDSLGRWLHPGNAEAFQAWVNALLEALREARLHVDTVVLDLEPPIAELRRITEGDLGAARGWLRRELDEAPHRRLVARLRAEGVEVLAAVAPPALFAGRAGEGFCRALGSPLDVGYDAVSAMLYTSLFEGYSFGAVSREDARALLARFARDAQARVAGAGASLGAVGLGALGDERTYRGVEELGDDVAIARAAGLEDLALFDLAGVLARPPIEGWLDALTKTEPLAAPPPSTARAQAIVAGLLVTGVALRSLGPGRANR